MPEEQPAMILNVPVGAMVVRVAFLTLSPVWSYTLPAKAGNTPLFFANSLEASVAWCEISAMTFPATFSASSEL